MAPTMGMAPGPAALSAAGKERMAASALPVGTCRRWAPAMSPEASSLKLGNSGGGALDEDDGGELSRSACLTRCGSAMRMLRLLRFTVMSSFVWSVRRCLKTVAEEL